MTFSWQQEEIFLGRASSCPKYSPPGSGGGRGVVKLSVVSLANVACVAGPRFFAPAREAAGRS